MKTHEYNVSSLTQFQDIRSEKASSCSFDLFDIIVKASHIFRCGIYFIIFISERFIPVYRLQATENIYENGIVSFLTKCLAYTGSGYDGDFSLCTGSTCQYNDIHTFISLDNFMFSFFVFF